MTTIVEEIRYKMETASGLIFAKSPSYEAAHAAIKEMCIKVEGFISAGELVSANEAVLAVFALFEPEKQMRA